jgi:hypothetical protein
MTKTPDDVTAAIQKLDASDQGMAVTCPINFLLSAYLSFTPLSIIVPFTLTGYKCSSKHILPS